jgi:tetratricopeptide (TPR) repeat protein
MGDRESAIRHFQNALHFAPDFEPAYIDLANILTTLDRKANLHALLIDGLKAIPESVELNFQLGRFLFLGEKFEEAISFLRRALTIDPSYEEAWVGQFICAKYQFRLDATIKFCRTVLAVNPARQLATEYLNEALQAREIFRESAVLIKASKTEGGEKVRLVCASQVKQDRFFNDTALGRSLHRYTRVLNNFELQLFPENREGLPLIYNRAIDYAKSDPAYLVFIHDDVFLTDLFWTERIAEALQTFDIFGVAGNSRRVPAQPSWYFVNDSFTPDESRYLSGTIGTGDGFPNSVVSKFGESRRECKLLDGVLMAAHSSTLMKADLYFDTRFKFHFYDIDFCRQAELKNLRMGTWQLSLVHVSKGNFGSTAWWESWNQYREKYGE